MESLSAPRIIIAATGNVTERAVVTLGLVMALRRRNISVSVAAANSPLVQAVTLKRLSGRRVRLLDQSVLSEGQILRALYQAGAGADLVLIDGGTALFDGRGPTSLRDSDAHLAILTSTPVLLTVPVMGQGGTVAAATKGIASFVPDLIIGGVVVTGILGDIADRLDWLSRAMKHHQAPPLWGGIPAGFCDRIEVRSDASQERNATLIDHQVLVDIERAVTAHIDIDALLAEARAAPTLQLSNFEHRPKSRRARMAVSEDSCFQLGYQDNLELLRYEGIDVVPFSPLADVSLPPQTAGIYLTGGCIADYAEDLEANRSMRAALRDFSAAGGIVYSEGSGTAYLCERYRTGDDSWREGVGLIPGQATYRQHGAEQRFDAVFEEESILGPEGVLVKGLTTREWIFESDKKVLRTLRLVDAPRNEREGLSPGAQVLSTFNFLHWGATPSIAEHVASALEVVCKLS